MVYNLIDKAVSSIPFQRRDNTYSCSCRLCASFTSLVISRHKLIKGLTECAHVIARINDHMRILHDWLLKNVSGIVVYIVIETNIHKLEKGDTKS